MPSDLAHTSVLDRTEKEVIYRHCAVLQLGPPDAIRRLSAGRSGSLVVRLTAAGRRMVLKITTAPERLPRARSELRMISQAPDALAAAMPRYIAGHDCEGTVCLVMEEHRPLPHPRDIPDEEWSALATDLGRLHSASIPPWAHLRTMPPVDAPIVANAAERWTHLGHADAAGRATKLILRDTASRPEVPEPVLEHGDCHTENIVRDEQGAFRWIDWQEAGLGDGFGDLVFLWQRAEFAGANPPREAMIGAYAAARHLRADPSLDEALDAAELRLLFISWPPFLAYGRPGNRRRMIGRLAKLVESLS